MRLTIKTGLTIVAILLFAVLVTSFLNYYKYQSTLADLVRSRLVVIGLDLKNTVEASVGLGIPLRQTENIQKIINRAKRGDDQILSVEVFETSAAGGARLFHTDQARIGEAVPEKWLKAVADANDAVWTADDKNVLVTGFSLVNNFNQTIGAVVVRNSKAYQVAKVAAMFEKLVRALLVVFTVTSALAFLGVFLLFRRLSSSFGRMTDSLNAVIAGNPPTLTEETATTDEETRYVLFQDKTAALLRVMDEANAIGLQTEK